MFKEEWIPIINLRLLRAKFSLSQVEMTKDISLSVSYLNEIESLKKVPKPEKLELLAGRLGLSLEELRSPGLFDEVKRIHDMFISGKRQVSFPLEVLGISSPKLIDLLVSSPDSFLSFLEVMDSVSRSYNVSRSDFFKVFLQEFQRKHRNYFPEIEKIARDTAIKEDLHWSISVEDLIKVLDRHKISVYWKRGNHVFDNLSRETKLRSFFRNAEFNKTKKKEIYINPLIQDEQARFILSRELGFHILGGDDRPVTSPVLDKDNESYESILNNFKASYFAGALMMPYPEITRDLYDLFAASSFNEDKVGELISKYFVTPEAFAYRISEVIPDYFNLERVHFLKFIMWPMTCHNEALNPRNQYVNVQRIDLVKQLNVNSLDNLPQGSKLQEFFCRKWVSCETLSKLCLSGDDMTINSGIVNFPPDLELGRNGKYYFCLSIAANFKIRNDLKYVVTIGFVLDEQLSKTMKFLKGYSEKSTLIGSTCERCRIQNCKKRLVAANYSLGEIQAESLPEILKQITAST